MYKMYKAKTSSFLYGLIFVLLIIVSAAIFFVPYYPSTPPVTKIEQPTGVQVVENKVSCTENIKEFFTSLYKEFGELPVMVGKNGTSKVVFVLYNKQGKTMTILEISPIKTDSGETKNQVCALTAAVDVAINLKVIFETMQTPS